MRKEEKFLTDIKNDLRSTGEKEENLIKYFLDRFRGKSYIVYQQNVEVQQLNLASIFM